MPSNQTDPVFDAFLAAKDRGAFATGLDTAGIRELAAEVRYTGVWTARGTSLVFAQEIQSAVDDILADKIDPQAGMLRLKLKLAALGYDPEIGGFPDAKVAPVTKGTLQDLSSFRRMKLIIETQVALMTGRGDKMRGETPEELQAFPAWELIRTLPRGTHREWPSRWHIAGGKEPGPEFPKNAHRVLYQSTGMIAFKGDPVWGELGSSENFKDALDVDHPPFAFESGMGWKAVSRARCEALGILGPNGESIDDWQESRPITLSGPQPLPAPKLSIKDLSPELVKEFQGATGAVPVAGKPTVVEPPRKADGSLDFSDLMAKAIARRNAARKEAGR